MMRRLVLSGALACCLGASPAEDAMTITTDTPEYCLHLASHMGPPTEMSPNARLLWQQGRALCERGHIRSGLARLRRAMLVIRGAAE